MASFVFELESVLKARAAAERQKQIALGEIERDRVAIEDDIRRIQQCIAAEKAELRDALSGVGGAAVDVRGVRLQANASLRLILAAQQAVLRLAGVHKRVEAARRELLEAARARKAVEMLKERRREAWLTEQRRLEAMALDELAIMRASRAGGALETGVGEAAPGRNM